MKIHNKYVVTVVDSNTKKVKQRVTSYNTALNGLWEALASNNGVYIRVGSGTTPAAATDTGLETPIWSPVDASFVASDIIDDENFMIRFRATFPAGTSYVANINEVGCSIGSSGVFISRTVLEEGINKTATDIVYMDVFLYVTLDPPVGGIWHPYKAACNSFFDWLVGLASLNNQVWALMPSIVNTDKGNCRYRNDVATQYYNLYYGYAYSIIKHGVQLNGVTATRSANSYTYTITSQELASTAGNIGYMNFLSFDHFFYAYLKDLMQPYMVEGVSVGTGDGATTVFNKPIPFFVENSEVIYVDGVAKTRGTDYTVGNKCVREPTATVSAEAQLVQGYEVGPSDPINHGASARNDLPNPLLNQYGYYSSRYEVWHGSVIASELQPYVFDLAGCDDVIGSTINYFHMDFNSLYLWHSITKEGHPLASIYAKYTLQGSNDLDAWTDICTIDASTVTPNSQVQQPFGDPCILACRFEPVTYRYLRIIPDWSYCDETGPYYWSMFNINASTDPNDSNHILPPVVFGYEGQEITFVDAPADGAVITMDCQLDRPYKTSDFRMTIPSLNFTIGGV